MAGLAEMGCSALVVVLEGRTCWLGQALWAWCCVLSKDRSLAVTQAGVGWHWEGAGSCRRDWASGRICGLELPVALPGAGALLGLCGVTFLHYPIR